jgi:hypothetical protein
MYNVASLKPWEYHNHECIQITSITHCVHARTHISDKQSKQTSSKTLIFKKEKEDRKDNAWKELEMYCDITPESRHSEIRTDFHC